MNKTKGDKDQAMSLEKRDCGILLYWQLSISIFQKEKIGQSYWSLVLDNQSSFSFLAG